MANNTDLIDKYLLGELSDTAKKQFEEALSNPIEGENLKKEIELQQEIITAIQARGLKETLKQKEIELRTRHKKKQHIQRVLRISSLTIVASVVAATILVTMILTPMAKIMTAESIKYAKTITISPTRGAVTNDLQMQLFAVYNNVSLNQFKQAKKDAKQLIKQLQHPPKTLNTEEVKDIYDQALWLQTICEMNQGHVFRAKKLLLQIANSDSHYASQAQDFLEKL